ncbi:MAG: hypothetical protein LBF88_10110 [Planctomycetaceae bacterium]|jgi:hypothetical protein|nr:hypothetical protein [Planctomycetaceae bacterium]
MWRLLRRQLRLWHKDFASAWGRLKTFHRTVLGILIAIAIVYAARKYWLDPISANIADAQSKYDKTEPPNPLPTIEDDNEIILVQEQIFQREKTAADKKAEMERVAKSRSKITPQNIDAVRSELETLISQNKLTLLLGGVSSKAENSLPTAKTTSPAQTTASAQKSNENIQKAKQETVTVSNEPPLKYEEFVYKAEGRFSDILHFLKQMETFTYPAKITQFYLGSPTTVAQSLQERRNEKLQLQFHFILYFHE